MNMRRTGLSRRSALTAVAASVLVGLTALAGSSAVASPRTSAPAATVVTPSLADLRLPSVADHKAVVARVGWCDAMMNDL
jgi:hypothetical protein